MQICCKGQKINFPQKLLIKTQRDIKLSKRIAVPHQTEVHKYNGNKYLVLYS